MTEHVAELMLYAISALGALVWLAGLRFLIASAQAGRLVSRQTAEQLEMEEPPTDDMIVGSAEVTGQPADLVSRAASLLAGGTASSLGLLKIVDRASDRLTFERAGEYAGGHAGRSLILKGQFRFAALGSNRTRIIYAVQLAPRRALLIGGVLFQFLGLAVLGVGFWAIQTYVVPNPNLAIRAQVFQMFQTGHFLWPPFLLGALYRHRYRQVRDALDAFAHNLPHG